MPRTHVRSHFYKLSTRAVAKIIIEHRTIRWRTPLQFNDPFDTQTRLTANVDPDKYADRFMQRLDELAFAPDVPPYVFGGWVMDATPEERDTLLRTSVAVLGQVHSITPARRSSLLRSRQQVAPGCDGYAQYNGTGEKA